VWIEIRHLVIQLLSSDRSFREPVEIADILSGLLDDLWMVVVFGSPMCSDNGAWIERLDFIDGRNPLQSPVRIRAAEAKVDIVVGGVSSKCESGGRNELIKKRLGPDISYNPASFNSLASVSRGRTLESIDAVQGLSGDRRRSRLRRGESAPFRSPTVPFVSCPL
jgi:hypothetical protein